MIRRLFQFIIDFFTNHPSNTSGDELNCEIDVDKMIKSLDLEQHAKYSAEHELPSSDAQTLDGTERKIEALIQKRMAELTNKANSRLVGYNTSLANTDINTEQQRIQNLAKSANLRLNSRLAEAEQQLRAMKNDLKHSATALQSFRIKHRRDTDAEYPESRLYHYSIVLLILVFEAIANGFFFARGSEFGILGGISQSLVVAILNIAPSFFFAGMVCFRYTNHVSLFKKGIAWIASLVYVTWIFVFNLCVAHYRDVLTHGHEEAIQQITRQIIESPLTLIDINSWLLLLMGAFFSLVAMVDGYKADDPYPKYGKLQRINDEIQEDYEFECRNLTQEALRIRGDFIKELEILKDTLKNAFTHQFHLAEIKPALVEKHKHCLGILNKAGDALIHYYRSTNTMHRKTPPPAYFHERWNPEKTFELVGSHDDSEQMDNQRALFENFPAFVQKTNNDIEEMYSSFFSRLQNIEPGFQSISASGEKSP